MLVLARKDTDVTLVNSPSKPTSPSPATCFGGLLGKLFKTRKKRAPSNDEKSEPASGVNSATDKPKPRPQSLILRSKPSRYDTNVTIAEFDGEDEMGIRCVENLKGDRGVLDQVEEDDRRDVFGPISETAHSSPFTLPSIIHTPSSLASELPSPTPPTSPDSPSAQLPRTLHFQCPHPPSKREGGTVERETKETFRSVTILAARTLVNVAEASNVPYLKGVAGLIALIIEYTDGASENKEDCEQIKRRVDDLANVIIQCVQSSNIDHSLHYDLESLHKRLTTVSECAQKLSIPSRSYLQRVTRQEEDREIIKRAEKALDHAFTIFSLQSHLYARSTLADINNLQRSLSEDMKEHIVEFRRVVQREIRQESLEHGSSMMTDSVLTDEPEEDPTAIGSVVVPIRTSILQRSPCESALEKAAAAARPPPAREIFYGRDKELKTLVDMVTGNSAARITIPGPGGIGKSALSIALLNNAYIIDKFGKYRFFIPCDSATSAAGLASVIASHLGISESKKHGWRETIDDIKDALSGASIGDGTIASLPAIGPFCMLVLDNFETPWEPSSGRKDVEDLLALLTEVDGLTLVITMRGIERPSGVRWTKPFLPVLQTLEPVEARRMFNAISDSEFPDYTKEDTRDALDELLDLCGYLPLAVELAATLAQPGLESVPNLIERWKVESTRVLRNGEDRRNNLEVSIELSLTSPRLQQKPGACTLLYALSLLPDGLRNDELRLAVPDLQDVSDCSLCLRKTSLAYVDSRNRIRALTPIRSYISSAYPAGKTTIKGLEDYMWGMFKAADSVEKKRTATPVRRVIEERGNIESLIIRAFTDFNPVPAIQAVVDLGRFYVQVSVGKPPTLTEALQISRTLGDKKLEADCMLITAAIDVFLNYGSKDAIELDLKRAAELYEEVNDKRGLAECMHRLARQYHNLRRFDECEEKLAVALRLYEETYDSAGQASTLLTLSRHYRVTSKPEMSMQVAERAIALAKTSETDRYMLIIRAQALQQIGDVCHVFQSDYARAREHFEKALAIHEELGIDDSSHYAMVLSSLGEVYIICSDYENAQAILEQAIASFCSMGVHDRAAYGLVKLSTAFSAMGQMQKATETIEKAEVLWNKANNEWGKGITMIAKGDILLSDKKFSEAEVHYEQALVKVRADSDFWVAFEAECLLKLGMLRKVLNKRDEALDYFRRALDKYRTAKQKIDETNCLRLIAELTLDNLVDYDSDEHELAVNTLREALQRYDEMGLERERDECDHLLAAACRQSESSQGPTFERLQA